MLINLFNDFTTGEVPREVIVEGDVLQVRLEGLYPATRYSFSIIAENTVGRSSPSPPLMHTTLEEPPTAYPINIKVSFQIL